MVDLLDAFCDAFARRDAAGVFRLFAPRDDVMVVTTGPRRTMTDRGYGRDGSLPGVAPSHCAEAGRGGARLLGYAVAGVIAVILMLTTVACADNPDGRGTDPTASDPGTSIQPQAEHVVIIRIPAPKDESDQLGLSQIEDPLIAALESSGAGEWDGHGTDLATGESEIYLYGPDADALYAAIESTLRDLPLPPGSYAVKQYGEPGARESRINLR